MSSEKKTNDATYGEDRAKHRAVIKERIISAVNKSGLTPYALYQRINDENASTYTDEERYNYGISYPTFLQTCNPDHKNICNLDTCLAIARYLKLPLDSLFAPPGEDTHTSESRIVTYPNAPYEILADTRYFGTFHGYMYSLNTNNKNAIEHFVLTINEHGASMRIYYYTKNPDGQTEQSFLDLAGTPIQIKDENVYMVLTNTDGILSSLHLHTKNIPRRTFISATELFLQAVVELTATLMSSHLSCLTSSSTQALIHIFLVCCSCLIEIFMFQSNPQSL